MASIKEIKKLTYKEHNHPIAKYIERPLSYYVIWLLVPFGVTGNQVSMFSILFFIVPFLLISTGDTKLAIVGTSLLLLISLLDCVDGGLARYYHNKTLKGRYYEFLFHELCIPALFFALGMYSFNFFNKNYYMILLGALTMFSTFLVNSITLGKHRMVLEYSIKHNKLPKTFINYMVMDRKSSNSFRRIGSYFILIFNGQANLFYTVFFLSLFGLLQYAIFFYAAFYSLIAIVKFYIEIKRGFKDYGLD